MAVAEFQFAAALSRAAKPGSLFCSFICSVRFQVSLRNVFFTAVRAEAAPPETLLHGGGQTIMLTTHYMEEADTLCDRLAIMDHGRILSNDTPKGLKNSVGADSIVSITAQGDLKKLGDVLKQGIPEATKSQQYGDTLQISVKGASGLLPKVIELAEKAGYSVTDISVTVPTLETVFINLTGKELRD